MYSEGRDLIMGMDLEIQRGFLHPRREKVLPEEH